VGPAWRAIADRHAVAGYVNAWTDGLANFTLAAIGLTAEVWDELRHASLLLTRASGRVLAHLGRHPGLLGVLGIPKSVAPLCAAAPWEGWSFLARLDWAWTEHARWKLLEINSDTPAGLWEAGSIEGDVARLHPRGNGPSAGFWDQLSASWRHVARQALGEQVADRVPSIGLVGVLGASEDADQLRAHARAARQALPGARVEIGTPEDLAWHGRRVELGGRPIDLLFRYYPLDWFAEPRWTPLLAAVAEGTLPMLPSPAALIPQSKAFLALLWELEGTGFFPPAEAAAITQYVARTTLDPSAFGRRGYVIKPYLEREGHGVRFSADTTAAERRRLAAAPVVYQERLDVTRARVPVATAYGWTRESRHLIFGVFMTGNAIAGLYTRAGARITGREAVYLPALTFAPSPARRSPRSRGTAG